VGLDFRYSSERLKFTLFFILSRQQTQVSSVKCHCVAGILFKFKSRYEDTTYHMMPLDFNAHR